MYFSRHLDIVGDGSGTTVATGDYSGGGGQDFLLKPGPKEVLRIFRLIVFIEDSAIDADAYGATAAGALTNGISVQCTNDTDVLIDLTDGHAIKTSATWAHFCYNAEVLEWGAGNEFMMARWTFTRGGGALDLRGDDVNAIATDGEKFVLHLEDSFIHLVDHRFIVQGQSDIVA